MSEGLTDRAKRLFNSLTGRVNEVEAPWLDGANYDSDNSSSFYTTEKDSIKRIQRTETQTPAPRQEMPMSRSRSQAEVDEQDERRMRALQARLAGEMSVGKTPWEGDGSKSNVDHNPSTAGRGRFFGGKR